MNKGKSVQTRKVAKPNRFELRRQRTYEAIVVAASAIFLKKGIANTTVSDITEEADVGYGTFYNHFHSLNDVISAVAEATMKKIVTVASEILPEEQALELAPAVFTRVFMRHLSKDPVIRCLLEQPYIFVDEWHKAVTPFMEGFRDRAPVELPHAYEAAGGAETIVRMTPWIIICELNHAIETAFSEAIEDNLVNMFIRLLGVDDDRRAEIVRISRQIVEGAVPASLPRRRGPSSRVASRNSKVRSKESS